jgi:hypothetical protein
MSGQAEVGLWLALLQVLHGFFKLEHGAVLIRSTNGFISEKLHDICPELEPQAL